ncbi:MAG: STAS domain-containing protein [Phycisphaerales bacterium]|jgi:anti-sigma B factor antagonist|eukprot:TRINITY_DN33598_c0_g2_i2.p2 TRINITY_DN33598_c0_g2~~TRINITY_DN33598_c0_g2_i2.p2  ORF type:complete len:120 (+),score=21.03 TRINITY_DN33598_c0_g2_i2:107-466(+)
MPAEETRLRITDKDGVTRVEFLDRNILDEASIQRIGDEITEVIDASSNPKLLISFNNVDHMSSAALGTLITIHHKIRNRSGQLRLADIDPQIQEVFSITKLDRIFTIHEDTESALQSFD